MNAPGWTRLPSFAACCRRLKGLSRSEQRGPVSTVSRSLLAPEIESRELCNSWRTRMSGRRQPPFNQRTEQNVCLLAPSSTVEMGGNNYGTILAIPVHWKYLVPGPWHVLSVQSRRRTAAAQLPSGLTCQSGLTLYVTVGRKGLGGIRMLILRSGTAHGLWKLLNKHPKALKKNLHMYCSFGCETRSLLSLALEWLFWFRHHFKISLLPLTISDPQWRILT